MSATSRVPTDVEELAGLEPIVRRYLAKWMDDADDLDDVAQRSLIRIWRGLDSFQGKSALSSWAYRVARNEFVSWRRSHRRAQRRATLDEPRCVPSPEGQVLARVAVGRWLSVMDAEPRRLLELLYLREMTSSEAARELGVAPSTVRCAHRRLRHERANRSARAPYKTVHWARDGGNRLTR